MGHKGSVERVCHVSLVESGRNESENGEQGADAIPHHLIVELGSGIVAIGACTTLFKQCYGSYR